MALPCQGPTEADSGLCRKGIKENWGCISFPGDGGVAKDLRMDVDISKSMHASTCKCTRNDHFQ